MSIILAVPFILTVIVIWHRFRFVLLLLKRRVKDAEDEVNHDLEALEKQLGKDSSRARDSIELARTNIVYKLDGIFKKQSKKHAKK